MKKKFPSCSSVQATEVVPIEGQNSFHYEGAVKVAAGEDGSASGTGPVAAEHYVRQHHNIDNRFQNETPNTREEISRAIQELREEWRVEKHGKKSLVKFAIIRIRMAKLVDALKAIMTI